MNRQPWKLLDEARLGYAANANPGLWEVVLLPWLQELTANRHRFQAPPWINPRDGLIHINSTRWAIPGARAEIHYALADELGQPLQAPTLDGSPGGAMYGWAYTPVEVPTDLMVLAILHTGAT